MVGQAPSLSINDGGQNARRHQIPSFSIIVENHYIYSLRSWSGVPTLAQPFKNSEVYVNGDMRAKNRVNFPIGVYAPAVAGVRLVPVGLRPVNTCKFEPVPRLPIGDPRSQNVSFDEFPIESRSKFVAQVSFQDIWSSGAPTEGLE